MNCGTEGDQPQRPNQAPNKRGDPGDQVIALFRMIARGEGSGLEVERLDAIIYRLKGAQIVRLEYFNDQEQALEAAGLSE